VLGGVGVAAGRAGSHLSRHLNFSDVREKYQPGKYDDANHAIFQVVGYSLAAPPRDAAITGPRATTSAARGSCARCPGPFHRRRIQRDLLTRMTNERAASYFWVLVGCDAAPERQPSPLTKANARAALFARGFLCVPFQTWGLRRRRHKGAQAHRRSRHNRRSRRTGGPGGITDWRNKRTGGISGLGGITD